MTKRLIMELKKAEVMGKETLYKTAWAPLYGQYVRIERAHQDDSGQWIYSATIPLRTDGITDPVLFRHCELVNFCL